MSSRLQRLDEINEIVSKNPNEVPDEIRKEFWRIVKEIKKEVSPDDSEIMKAAKIRDFLFEANRGGTYSLRLGMIVEGILGILAVIGYFWALGFELQWLSILSWSLNDWTIFVIRFLFVFAVIAFLYPFGRLIAGRWTGIKILGMCRDQYYEPTLKIDYETFLKAPPPRRKWFFFFAGIWTIITSLWLGMVGLIIDWDLTAFIPVVLLMFFEGHVIHSGNPKASGGEMGHYNREKLIEKAWMKKKGIK